MIEVEEDVGKRSLEVDEAEEKPSKKVRHDEAVEGNGENEQAVGPVEVVVDSVGVVLDSLETVDPVEAIESVEGIDPTELTHNKANTPESIVGEVSATIDDPLTEQSTTLTGESAKESTVMESPTPKKTAATKAAINSPATALPAGIPSLDTTTQPTVTNPDAMVEERTQVSSLYVGRVIGKGGEMIRDLQARSGCRIDVDQNVPAGQPRIITYRGTRRTVEDAKKMVLLLCQQDGSETLLPIGEAKRKHLTVPSSSIGKIIGRGGEMIRELQNRSQAKIQVDHSGNSQTGNTRAMTITGTNQAVVKAEEMVLFLVANPLMDAMISINMLMEDKIKNGGRWGSGPPYMNMANHGQNMMPPGQQQPQLNMHGGGTSASNFSQSGNSGFGGGFPGYPQPATHQGSVGHYGILPTQQSHFAGVSDVEVFFAAKMFMGRIIGQKGMTINDVQKISGCDIQVNQNVPHGQDCEITIKGSRQGIENVKQMLREIIEMGPNHPYAGGQGQYNGGSGQVGGSGGYSQVQHSAYGSAAQPSQAYVGYQQQPPLQHSQIQQPMYVQPPYGSQQPAYLSQQSFTQPLQIGVMPSYQQTPMQQYSQPTQYNQQPQQYQTPNQQQYTPLPMVVQPAVVWKSAKTGDGQVYYYNEKTGETQWDKPVGMP